MYTYIQYIYIYISISVVRSAHSYSSAILQLFCCRKMPSNAHTMHLDFAVILRAHSFIASATTYSTYFYVAKI